MGILGLSCPGPVLFYFSITCISLIQWFVFLWFRNPYFPVWVTTVGRQGWVGWATSGSGVLCQSCYCQSALTTSHGKEVKRIQGKGKKQFQETNKFHPIFKKIAHSTKNTRSKKRKGRRKLEEGGLREPWAGVPAGTPLLFDFVISQQVPPHSGLKWGFRPDN